MLLLVCLFQSPILMQIPQNSHQVYVLYYTQSPILMHFPQNTHQTIRSSYIETLRPRLAENNRVCQHILEFLNCCFHLYSDKTNGFTHLQVLLPVAINI